jgi:hypothetical protein
MRTLITKLGRSPLPELYPSYRPFVFSRLSQPGWPTNYEALKRFIPYNGTKNMCKDCSSRRRGVCEDHKQSPIPLNRNVTASRECIDRHLMKVRRAGTCSSYAEHDRRPDPVSHSFNSTPKSTVRASATLTT